ncbi:MAG: ABC transporter permease [Pseudomonadota bacterium]
MAAGWSALWSHWRRHPLQLFTLIAGLAMATALWSGVQAINGEARTSYAEAEDAVARAALPRLVNPEGPIPIAYYVALRRAGWDVTPLLEGPLRIDGSTFQVRGIETLTAVAPPTVTDGGNTDTDIGPVDILTGDGIVFAARSAQAQLEDAGGLPRIVAAEGLGPRQLITDIRTATRLLGSDGAPTSLLILPDQRPGLTPLADLVPGLEERDPVETEDLGRLTDSFHLNLTAFGLLSFAVGLFIVHGAIGLAFEQRRAMFRTLRALGLPLRQLVLLLILELGAITILGALIGLALGYLIAALLLPDVAATLRGLYGAPVEGGLVFRPLWAAAGLAMAAFGAGVAAAEGIWRVARMPILTGAMPRAWALASTRTLRRQGVLAVLLSVLALVLATMGSGLVAGFVMLGALLVAAALLLPIILLAVLRTAERASKGVVAGWFWADTRQQVPGLSLALMALLLALAANIGVGTMVASFRTTFIGWLDQRLASELYVTARTEDEAARLREWLAPRSEAVLPIWSVDATLGGRQGEVYGIRDHATYRDHWPLLGAAPDVWDRVAAGEGALINEQMARRLGIGIGDPADLAEDWALPVAGVYSDYGNPQPQAIVGVEALAARYPDISKLRHGIRVAPDRVNTLRAALTDDFGLPDDLIIDQAAIKSLSVSIFERTFAVTGALNVLTLGIAALAILTSLLTLAGLRLPQLAPVWAIGLTRTKLGRLEVVRTLLLAVLTAIVALPVGLLLAFVLLAIINVEAFGWRIGMAYFPLDWLRLFLLAALAAGLAALLPARRLARTPPAILLKVFANER